MIYVFKISVKTKMQAKKLKPHIDKILRIDSEENIVLKITGLLNIHQFFCEELE
jgi:hypothetical protein